MRLTYAGALVFTTLVSLSGCSETAASGAFVPIPSVYVNCTTAQCKTNASPVIIVFITTSGCTSPDFGYTRSASTTSITCNGTTGCYGQISGWTDGTNTTQTIPSGSYSICAIIDYNHSYPPSGTGDSAGTLDNVAIGATTANQFVTTFTDL